MIQATNIIKTYKDGEKETRVLKGVDFFAKEKDFVAIMGRSGAGKSTLLYQMSMLDQPSSGEIIIDGVNVLSLTDQQKSAFRLKELGYVFQDYALLPDLTALENVALPLLMKGENKKTAYKHATEMLEKVGLGHRVNNIPSNLSGGEQQRVSIARAIVHKPKVLFADEPTANLDNESSKQVIAIFKELNEAGQTIIMVTHEEEYAKIAKRIVRLDDGKIVE
jgi:putative ABC transport system ATP-binding protein